MSNCPACGVACDFDAVCRAGACPACGTALAELHTLAIEGGGS